MLVVITILTLLFWGLLLHENFQAKRDRRKLRHVIHVNGIRGKSTVCRLITAGLTAGGIPTFCKTTGTDPMTIDPAGREAPIKRRGPSNIREQCRILHQAAGSGAHVLVIECMAIAPDLQKISQNRMLQADIGVITNVRRDHTDLMGDSLPDIADSLSSTIPQHGTLFTAEEVLADRLALHAADQDCHFVEVHPDGTEPRFDFPENIALALKVCEHLGVNRETALAGMAGFSHDPYALQVYSMGPHLFVNALSANDPQSTTLIWRRIQDQYGKDYPRKVLILNNRRDRPTRTRDMLALTEEFDLDEIFLLGAGQFWLKHRLNQVRPGLPVTGLPPRTLPKFEAAEPKTLFFAAGNLAGEGRRLLEKIKKEGIPLV